MTTKQHERIANYDVHQTFNGFPMHFTRRRYGKSTFTWLDWWNGSEWVSAGDPWQSITIPRADLVRLFGEPNIKKESNIP